ncbi:RNA-directed DNA polymerase, eukaryota, reverse transcriptase zinc-binding domain protein [Tanacetum coccineum]
MDERKLTWVCWRKVMAQKQYDGLGVSSLYALNCALLFKWIWRFLSSQSGLWLSVIKAIHGSNGSLDQPLPTCTGCSIWITIHKIVTSLKSKGVDLLGFYKKVIGNCNNSNFCCVKVPKSRLCGFFRRHPRGGIEESQFQKLSLLLSSVVLSSSSNYWSWTLNCHGDFSVKSVREEIDKNFPITSSSSMRWSKLLPIKLNVFAWRMFLDKLPTRINLFNRGLDIPCVLCPNCGNAVQSRNHLFFGCSMALDLFRLLGRWWNIDIINLIDRDETRT